MYMHAYVYLILLLIGALITASISAQVIPLHCVFLHFQFKAFSLQCAVPGPSNQVVSLHWIYLVLPLHAYAVYLAFLFHACVVPSAFAIPTYTFQGVI